MKNNTVTIIRKIDNFGIDVKLNGYNIDTGTLINRKYVKQRQNIANKDS